MSNVTTSLVGKHRRAEGLRRLPERCRLLLSGLHNSENDPRLIFDHVEYRDAMAVAQRDPYVAVALGRLPDGFWLER